jgi:xanthine dehydrogenase accessory factor
MLKEIGDAVVVNETIGHVGSSPLRAQISGCLWGIVRNGVVLKKGQKIGDIDPRGKREHCFAIASQGRTIAEGVLFLIHNKERIERNLCPFECPIPVNPSRSGEKNPKNTAHPLPR